MKTNSGDNQPAMRKAKAKKVNVQDLDIAVRERLDDKKLNDQVFHLNKDDGLGTGDEFHSRRKFLIGAAGGLASLGALAVGSNAFGAGPAFADSIERQRAAIQTGGVGARNTIWFSATNIADPYYKFGVSGMKAAASLLGLKTQLVGPPVVDYAAQVQSFTTLLADPSTLGILSSFQDPSAAVPLYKEAWTKGIPIADVGGGSWGMPRLTIAYYTVSATPDAVAPMVLNALGAKGGRVGYISNLLNADLIAEEKIFASLMKQAKNITYVGFTNHNGTASDALSKYTSFCAANRPNAMWFGDGLGPSIVTGLLSAAPGVKLALRGWGPSGLTAIEEGKAIGTADRSEFEEEFWPTLALYMAAVHHYNAPFEFELNVYSVTTATVKQFIAQQDQWQATTYV
jgi:ABC-type sugar transport system substrate-binding protein